MVHQAKGRLFRRRDGKFSIYLPKNLAEDSMFPFKDLSKSKRGGSDSKLVRVSFEQDKAPRLLVEEWAEPEKEAK